MTSEKTATRRRYSRELKAQILVECDAPGASVAKVAMSHGINANVVHGWRKLARHGGAVVATREFVSVAMAPLAPELACERNVEIELHRGSLSMKIIWPVSGAAGLAAWTRELLR